MAKKTDASPKQFNILWLVRKTASVETMNINQSLA